MNFFMYFVDRFKRFKHNYDVRRDMFFSKLLLLLMVTLLLSLILTDGYSYKDAPWIILSCLFCYLQWKWKDSIYPSLRKQKKINENSKDF